MRSKASFRAMWGLLSLIALAGLVIVEAITRHRYPEATHAAVSLRIEGEMNAWRRPHARFHHVGDGIFDLEFPAAPGDSARVMIVGDSFSMGHGVGTEHRFGAVLQKRLNERAAVDVLAVSSYSPIIYRNVVRQALSSADYSVAAVFVDQTDPADDVIYRNDLLHEGAHEFDLPLMTERKALVDETYAGMRQSLSGWRGLFRRSALFNRLSPLSLAARFPRESRHYRYVRLALARGLMVHAFEERPESEAVRQMESLLFRHLDEIVELCRAQGVELIFAANPWEYQVSERPRVGRAYAGPYPRENRLERLLDLRYGNLPGVQVLELTRAFRRHPDPSGLFLDRPANEIHWNRAGHALVGRTLAEKLTATGPG